MQTARKAIEAALDGQRVKPESVAKLTQSQFDGMNALRAKNGMPPLPSLDVDYLGRHHANSRAADGYATQDMLKQLMSALDDSSIPVVDHLGRVGLESRIKRHDGYGNAVSDLATFNVDGNRTLAEVLSVIPKGDKGSRPIDQMKKAGVQPPGFLSGPVSDRSQRIGSIQPIPSVVTEQNVRNWIAQDNAVKMLGLPENNTAMDRARAMGYVTPAYHGTHAGNELTEFSRGNNVTAADHYFSPIPGEAGHYGNSVFPVLLRGRMKDVTDAYENPYGYNQLKKAWREYVPSYEREYSPFEGYLDDVMGGQLYQSSGGQSAQNA